jgi:sporulation protein YlmC with PRC-barrel domain
MSKLLSARDLQGNEIYDRQGNKLGTIEDLMLDLDSARVQYAVLAFGTPLGQPTKHFAVPVGALALDSENECFVVSTSKERLSSAEGFDVDSPPEAPDSLFSERAPEPSRLGGGPR